MTLNEFFEQNSRAALAFSGGVDSSYLLYAAMQAGADIKAYYVKAQFQPQFEFDDAMKLAEQLGADVRIIYADVLADPEVAANPADRCYYCKRNIFSQILQAAGEDGYRLILDGTNASDRADDRPGMKALKEMEVRSPLRECGLTKAMIRDLSRQAGLFTWNKPAYACLATRIPEGTAITDELLQMTEQAEDYLFS
ncbi:MAG: ATP-dependent sacrificial sulfur transferase LarE, partial [Lachnospiraceae bacterium]|nr:ATP-dependent sacrificial sulfur transferase LarE [Lachnospiraceae bacterium]